jgi:hypothetical protein
MSDAAAKTHAAADALLDWLRTQPKRVPAAVPLLPRPVEATAGSAGALFDGVPLGDEPAGPVAGGRRAWSARARSGASDGPSGHPDLLLELSHDVAPVRATAQSSGTDATLRLPNTDWLHHRMTVSGPAGDLADFRLSASGAGTIPWRLDTDRMAEDFFHLLVAPPAPQQRTLSLPGARIVAAQLRAAVARRHGMAVARVGRSRACPFDLHALVPVPADILALGPDDPAALDWLWARWGTSQPLRQVAVDGAATSDERRRPGAGQGALHLVFWSADWTPWAALAAIAARWPALRFDVRPTYEVS